MLKPRYRWLPCMVLAIAFAISPARAFLPDPATADLEIPLPEFDAHGYSSPQTQAARADVLNQITERHGGRWHVWSFHPSTNTPASLYGSGLDLALASPADADAEAAARRFVLEHPAVFGADPGTLVLDEIRRGLGKTAIHYQQEWEGLEVLGARLHLTMTEQGRLIEMGSRFRSLDKLRSVEMTPVLSSSTAEEIAIRDLPYDPITDGVEPGTCLLVLPVPASILEEDLHLVWQVRVRTESPIGIWVTHVDARDGRVLWRYNDVRFLNYQGSSDGTVEPVSYCYGTDEAPTRYQKVEVTGLPPVNTDQQGEWTVSYGGTDPRTVTSRFFGPYIEIHNQGGSDAVHTGTATPGVPHAIAWSDLNSQADERDVWDAVTDVHDFYLQFAPDFPLINSRIWANVSINQGCNAFWSGSINFYRQLGSCANTGRVQAVVYHEYGHAVQHVTVGQQGGEGLGEGNSDVLSNLMTQESTAARGFYLNNCDTGLRYSKNQYRYPEHVVGQEAHNAGRVIAGVHWDALERLQAIYGPEEGTLIAASTWHYGRWLLRPLLQPDQVMAMFVADDDNGDLDDGTPNYDTWCLAAENHGFGCPEISLGPTVTHEPLPSRTTPGDAVLVATIQALNATLDASSLRLFARLDGGAFEEMALAPTGNPDEYAATLTGLAVPTEVEYYLEAAIRMVASPVLRGKLHSSSTHSTWRRSMKTSRFPVAGS